MPQSNAILDCSSITAAGHVIPHSYAPISVSQFMDDLYAEEDALCNHTEDTDVSLILGGSSFAERSILLYIEYRGILAKLELLKGNQTLDCCMTKPI